MIFISSISGSNYYLLVSMIYYFLLKDFLRMCLLDFQFSSFSSSSEKETLSLGFESWIWGEAAGKMDFSRMFSVNVSFLQIMNSNCQQITE